MCAGIYRALALGAALYVASCFGVYLMLVHLFAVHERLAALLSGVTVIATAPVFVGATLYSIQRRQRDPSRTVAWNSMLGAAISWGLTATFSVAAVVVGTRGNAVATAILGVIAGLGAVFAARQVLSLLRSNS